MKKTVSFLFALIAVAFVLASCDKPAAKQEMAQPAMEQKMAAAPAPTEEEAAGFDEFPIGDETDVGPLHVGGVYFQPVDMEPAGNSLSKNEADCHVEADISANDNGSVLGYGVGDFVPYLHVKAYIQKHGSSKVQEVAFMPMNASDGPHYGANMKFEEGLGKFPAASGRNRSLLNGPILNGPARSGKPSAYVRSAPLHPVYVYVYEV